MANAIGLWMPTFFYRSHGWEVADAGIVFGMLLFICGPLGALFGGWCADKYDGAKRVGGPFVIGAGFAAVAIIPATFSTLVESHSSLFAAWCAHRVVLRTYRTGSIGSTTDNAERIERPNLGDLPADRQLLGIGFWTHTGCLGY
jgi:nitrate/nitrite transporter NarK